MAVFCYQLKLVQEKLNIITYDADLVYSRYEIGLKYQRDFEAKFGEDVMPMIKVTMLIEARNTLKNLDHFRAYIALRSTYGRNLFSTSNKIAILSRMLGCKSKEAYEYYTANSCKILKSILPTFKKYSNRWHMDKLLLALAEKKYIMYISKKQCRDIYFSRYMLPNELVDLVNDRKAKNNLKNEIKNAALSLQ